MTDNAATGAGYESPSGPSVPSQAAYLDLGNMLNDITDIFNTNRNYSRQRQQDIVSRASASLSRAQMLSAIEDSASRRAEQERFRDNLIMQSNKALQAYGDEMDSSVSEGRTGDWLYTYGDFKSRYDPTEHSSMGRKATRQLEIQQGNGIPITEQDLNRIKGISSQWEAKMHISNFNPAIRNFIKINNKQMSDRSIETAKIFSGDEYYQGEGRSRRYVPPDGFGSRISPAEILQEAKRDDEHGRKVRDYLVKTSRRYRNELAEDVLGGRLVSNSAVFGSSEPVIVLPGSKEETAMRVYNTKVNFAMGIFNEADPNVAYSKYQDAESRYNEQKESRPPTWTLTDMLNEENTEKYLDPRNTAEFAKMLSKSGAGPASVAQVVGVFGQMRKGLELFKQGIGGQAAAAALNQFEREGVVSQINAVESKMQETLEAWSASTGLVPDGLNPGDPKRDSGGTHVMVIGQRASDSIEKLEQAIATESVNVDNGVEGAEERLARARIALEGLREFDDMLNQANTPSARGTRGKFFTPAGNIKPFDDSDAYTGDDDLFWVPDAIKEAGDKAENWLRKKISTVTHPISNMADMVERGVMGRKYADSSMEERGRPTSDQFFSLNPDNPDAKIIISRRGGSEAFRKRKAMAAMIFAVKDYQLNKGSMSEPQKRTVLNDITKLYSETGLKASMGHFLDLDPRITDIMQYSETEAEREIARRFISLRDQQRELASRYASANDQRTPDQVRADREFRRSSMEQNAETDRALIDANVRIGIQKIKSGTDWRLGQLDSDTKRYVAGLVQQSNVLDNETKRLVSQNLLQGKQIDAASREVVQRLVNERSAASDEARLSAELYDTYVSGMTDMYDPDSFGSRPNLPLPVQFDAANTQQ